jgi:hypothetical protein
MLDRAVLLSLTSHMNGNDYTGRAVETDQHATVWTSCDIYVKQQ